MMWWGGSGSWGHGWWWPGIAVTAVFMVLCMVMMVRMVSHGMSGSQRRRHDAPGDGPEHLLANRLASGEIDVHEYERLLDAIQRPTDSTRP